MSVQESPVEASVNRGLPWGPERWLRQCWQKSFWRRLPLLPLPHSFVSGHTTGREHSAYWQKIGLKIYWAWPHPSEQDPDSPTARPSHQYASTSLVSFSIRGQAEWKPQSQKTNQTDHLGHSLVVKLWAMPCRATQDRLSWWRVLTKCGPLEKGMHMQTTSVLPWEPHEQYEINMWGTCVSFRSGFLSVYAQE